MSVAPHYRRPRTKDVSARREVLVSDDILRKEMSHVFGRCWIYVGHASELKKPGDFRSRKVAGRPVIFCRDQTGAIHCLFNTCRHRGAIVCTQRDGNARRFMCIYHGWIYNNDGTLARVPGDDAYAEAFDPAAYGLKRPARFEEYRGFWFMCLDGSGPLADYLAAPGLHRPGHRPVAVGADGIIAGVRIRRRRQLEADGENSVDDYPCPRPIRPAQLHGQFRRQDQAAEEEGWCCRPRQGGRARQRSLHHRQHQFPRPAGGQMDPLYGAPARRRSRIRGELLARLGGSAPRRRHTTQPGDLPEPR
jgi:nitrite reductase/ring-hydroxylating ferredoxin subunit